MKYILSLLVLILLLVPIHAKEPYTLGDDGLYTGSDGGKYVRKDNWTWVAPTSYTYCGRCYQNAGYWKFAGYSYTAYVAPAGTRDYLRARIADAILVKQKQESAMILSANEHNQDLELIQELGLTGALKGSDLFPQLASPYRAKYVVPLGNTLYSSAQVETQIYGTLDQNIFAQQGMAYLRDGQASMERGWALAVNYADKAGERDSRNLEIREKGIAASRALYASGAAPSTVVKETAIYPSNAVGPPQGLQLTQRRAQAIRACVQCHSGNDPKGGYVVSSHWTLPPEKQREAIRRMLLDPRDRDFMPRGGVQQNSAVITEFLPTEERARLAQ